MLRESTILPEVESKPNPPLHCVPEDEENSVNIDQTCSHFHRDNLLMKHLINFPGRTRLQRGLHSSISVTQLEAFLLVMKSITHWNSSEDHECARAGNEAKDYEFRNASTSCKDSTGNDG